MSAPRAARAVTRPNTPIGENPIIRRPCRWRPTRPCLETSMASRSKRTAQKAFSSNGKENSRSELTDLTENSKDFQVLYTFGVAPLQQYLIGLPGGRLQAFGIAWDARPASDGGQRWYHLYPDRKLAAGDPLHWTGIDQNWNYQCAFCHSTNLQKNYDAATTQFKTTWSEISVGCEACHGPGSRHLDWATKTVDGKRVDDPGKGFAFTLDERPGVSWRTGLDGYLSRSVPRTEDKVVHVCAACHSRRQQFSSDPLAVSKFFDAFRPSLLAADLYHSDGQQRDEVYNYGSFLQSRMHAAGVTCSDCHNPHSGALRHEGNATCTQCHASERFDAPAHHHHEAAIQRRRMRGLPHAHDHLHGCSRTS